jgi:hypothetical protein
MARILAESAEVTAIAMITHMLCDILMIWNIRSDRKIINVLGQNGRKDFTLLYYITLILFYINKVLQVFTFYGVT